MPIPADTAFEAALADLEQIVESLERGGPDLGRALEGYARGIELLGHCQGVLDRAERSVALLAGVDDAGRPLTAPFDAAATAAAVVPAVVATPPPPPPIPTPTPAPAADRPRDPAAIPEAPF